jgi:putative acetyltransferase
VVLGAVETYTPASVVSLSLEARIRDEVPDDFDAVEALVEAAFGRPDEARLVRELRDGGYLVVSLVACVGGVVVGHVGLSVLPIERPDGVVRGVSLAPLAVDAAHRRRGVGERLVREGIAAASKRGADAVVVLGDPRYYRRFGFGAELASRLSSPLSGPSFMALEIMPACLGRGGRVCYAPPFGLGAF